MKTLVTGAAGLTGGAVVGALQTAGHSVVGLVRSERHAVMLPSDTEVAIADCRDHARMETIVGSVDAVVHVAGILLGGELAALRALTKPSSIVVVSTAGIYSAHRVSSEAYRINEAALRLARPDVIVVRPTMIYGSERDRNVHHVIHFAHRYGVLPLFGASDRHLQPVHYLDLAAAIAALVGKQSIHALDIGGAEPLTLRAAAEAIFSALGRPARFIPVPITPALAAARLIDGLRGSRWVERIERMSEDRSVDNRGIRTLTNVNPRDFVTGVHQQVAEMSEALHR